LEASKWKIENQKGKKDLVVEVENPKQSVYIYKCTDSVVTIKGKTSSIALDSCTKTAIVFDDVIATAEIVNCKRVQVQANSSIPNISVDKTEGVTIYVQSEAGKKLEIVTSASVEVNVVTPGKTENDDPKEQAIPHQFVTVFQGDNQDGQEEKEQRPQQEGPRPRQPYPLQQLLAMHAQGQGHQALHHPQHGRVCCHS